jgi:hypothetical protein
LIWKPTGKVEGKVRKRKMVSVLTKMVSMSLGWGKEVRRCVKLGLSGPQLGSP